LWAKLEEEDQSVPYYQIAIELYISQGREPEALARAQEMKATWQNAVIPTPTRFRFASYLEESGRTMEALQWFAELAADEPESVEAEMAMLKIARLQLSFQNDPVAAKATITDFLDRYPKSEWRRFAERILERAQSPSASAAPAEA